MKLNTHMRKVIAAINMTLDGFCDHTSITADDALHQHYSELLRNAGVILYGRKTYHLMEYWRTVIENPSGNQATDEFAMIIDKLPKIVFSHTLKSIEWKSTTLAKRELGEEVSQLKHQAGKDVLVGSRSLIIALLNMNLVDEFQLCVHPVIVGEGLPLFDDITDRINLKLVTTKTLSSAGSIILYYERA